MKGIEAERVSKKERKTANKAAQVPAGLISLEVPETIARGQKATVKLKHQFPADLGEKPVQVTLKGGGNERIERKEVKASGTGVIEVTFDIPAEIPGGKVIFAGLVGKGIKDALQQIQTTPTPVK
jgi:hypothetical protein